MTINSKSLIRYIFEPYFGGWFEDGNFYSPEGKLLKKRYYTGRVVIVYNRKQYSVDKLKMFAKKINIVKENLPF